MCNLVAYIEDKKKNIKIGLEYMLSMREGRYTGMVNMKYDGPASTRYYTDSEIESDKLLIAYDTSIASFRSQEHILNDLLTVIGDA